jgi:hypothetical protein
VNHTELINNNTKIVIIIVIMIIISCELTSHTTPFITCSINVAKNVTNMSQILINSCSYGRSSNLPLSIRGNKVNDFSPSTAHEKK